MGLNGCYAQYETNNCENITYGYDKKSAEAFCSMYGIADHGGFFRKKSLTMCDGPVRQIPGTKIDPMSDKDTWKCSAGTRC